jgi:zinc transporter ZupT
MLAYQLSFSFGFLLYLGASDLLPQVHEQPRWTLILCTLGGLLTAAFVVFTLERLHSH